jgi:hypothetical protein
MMIFTTTVGTLARQDYALNSIFRGRDGAHIGLWMLMVKPLLERRPPKAEAGGCIDHVLFRRCTQSNFHSNTLTRSLRVRENIIDGALEAPSRHEFNYFRSS